MNKRTAVVLGSLGAVVVLIGLALIVMRVVFFAPYKSPSNGMYPSLPGGSHIWVNRFDKTPAYGAVLVFHYPENPEQDFDKRVVGLPGDVIETRSKMLWINGWEVPHCVVGKHRYVDEDVMAHHEGTLEVEWLGDDAHLVFHDDVAFLESSGPFTVKNGEYFVMGDNRENSHDSRMWFGGAGAGVPEGNTVGRVRMGKLVLPRGAESLQPALGACLAKKPAKTTPPSHA
jgi:signal peptidase I